MTATNLSIFQNETLTNIDRKRANTYKVFQVFELPIITEISDLEGNLLSSLNDFLDMCLQRIQARNQANLEKQVQHSGDYFTSLNHAERYRIPLAMRRLNGGFTESHFGLMSFIAMRGENVKNKVYNQRVSSINPDLLKMERISEIILPCTYQLQHPIKLAELGRVIEVQEENFRVVRVYEKWLGI
ncbi:MAG: hypothetical protein HKM04_00890 [Legionellales bacterium]|nr:hypothetical protein [Legionellales bacterium]